MLISRLLLRLWPNVKRRPFENVPWLSSSIEKIRKLDDIEAGMALCHERYIKKKKKSVTKGGYRFSLQEMGLVEIFLGFKKIPLAL